MKRITMKDFRWLSIPARYEKNHREVRLEVDPAMTLPQGPLLLAVSDESFTVKATMSIPAPNAFCGICAYHMESTFVAVGLSKDTVEIHSCIHGHHSISRVPFNHQYPEARWYLQRHSSKMEIGLVGDDDEKAITLISCSLPASEDSISFGFYFSNETKQMQSMKMYAFSYTKEI